MKRKLGTYNTLTGRQGELSPIINGPFLACRKKMERGQGFEASLLSYFTREFLSNNIFSLVKVQVTLPAMEIDFSVAGAISKTDRAQVSTCALMHQKKVAAWRGCLAVSGRGEIIA